MVTVGCENAERIDKYSSTSDDNEPMSSGRETSALLVTSLQRERERERERESSNVPRLLNKQEVVQS